MPKNNLGKIQYMDLEKMGKKNPGPFVCSARFEKWRRFKFVIPFKSFCREIKLCGDADDGRVFQFSISRTALRPSLIELNIYRSTQELSLPYGREIILPERGVVYLRCNRTGNAGITLICEPRL